MQLTKHRPQRRVPLWAIRCGFLLAIASLLATQTVTLSRLNESNRSQLASKARIAQVVAMRHGGRETTERTVRVLLRHTLPASEGNAKSVRLNGGDSIAHLPLDPPSSALNGATESQQSLRDCKVIIINQHVDYHYEVLESIIALYPLPKIKTCNHMKLQFTASISTGSDANPRYQRKSNSWRDYAMTNIVANDYFARVTPGQSRRLVEVIQTEVPLNDTLWDETFDYQISASCYCDPNLMWLLNATSHFCLFHGACDPTFLHENAPNRVQWLHPSFGEYSFFPNYLPQFSVNRTADVNTHHLCIIGNGLRRQYNLVALYLADNPVNIRLHHFGLGDMPTCMLDFAPLLQFHSSPDFVPWQYDVFSTCDAVLSLLTRQNQSEYFEGKTKLSGALVQASVYQIPVLLHQDLAVVYEKHLGHVETHTDDPASFAEGMDRLLNRLVGIKGV